jgi:hypothetical protein
MNSNTKYNDIEFCTNLLFNAIYGVNDNCYQIQPIDKKNIKIEDLRKPLNYNYKDIFKGKLKFLGYYNNRIHYKVSQHFHSYEIGIGINNLNINDINRPELQNMAYLLMCSEIVFNEKFINFTLPIMCFDIIRTELEKVISSFNDDIKDTKLESSNENKLYVIVTEHFLSTQTLKEYLDDNIESLTPEQLKKIIFEIFIIIAKLNERFNNFNHNNINLHSLKICKLSKPETRKYKISGIIMEISNADFILKIDDFDNAVSSDYNFDENKDILYNPYVDINIIMNHLHTFLVNHKKMNTEVEEFFDDIIPEKYRPKLDIDLFNQNSDITITSEIVLKKNKFFKNFIKMEVSVTPRNIEKMDIENLQQKDEGILYIDYNKKNKKSNKYYSMYKGVRQIVVPGLKKNTKKDATASEGSLFFKDELTEDHTKNNKKGETLTETTVRETMNTIKPNVTSSSSSSSDSNNNNKKDSSSSSSSSSSESETATQKGMTEISADSKAIMRALAQNTDSKSEMSRSKKTDKSSKKSSKGKGKRNARESSSLSSSIASVKMSEGGMNANLSSKNMDRLNKLPANYFDLAPESLVQQMMNEGVNPTGQPQGMGPQGMRQPGPSGQPGLNPMAEFLGNPQNEMGPQAGYPPPGYPPQGYPPGGPQYQQFGNQMANPNLLGQPPSGLYTGMPGQGYPPQVYPQQGGSGEGKQQYKLNFF